MIKDNIALPETDMATEGTLSKQKGFVIIEKRLYDKGMLPTKTLWSIILYF